MVRMTALVFVALVTNGTRRGQRGFVFTVGRYLCDVMLVVFVVMVRVMMVMVMRKGTRTGGAQKQSRQCDGYVSPKILRQCAHASLVIGAVINLSVTGRSRRELDFTATLLRTAEIRDVID